ncbi:PHP domain-containing protein [Kribbella italica]|uniref:Histidinol-phosphatase n=1 Tax=Kribbella italica TaxID=1540520 RepID=A0A7W9J142_9ACTN|nr:PHP domain-containing protein [Kribbella italica]MBB5833696.1 histidinol-phosphatase (PHP family) [Kribbella italica]
MQLPADGHVHTEWSWDTDRGSMDATCARAVALGLPVVAFTEHVDFTPFRAGFLAPKFTGFVTDGLLQAPPLDVAGYLESIDRCRFAYPELKILTGLEIGQPHLHVAEVASLLAQGTFDRVIGSLHCLPDEQGVMAEPWELFPHQPAPEVFRGYLTEIPRMLSGSTAFNVLGHIDYPVRSWPGPFNPHDFEEELRAALTAVAAADRALELNTRLPLDPLILRWWRESGGRQLTFGSDAHYPEALATGLAEAATIATAHGFAPDSSPTEPWRAVT